VTAQIKKALDKSLEILVMVVVAVLVLDVLWQVFTRFVIKIPSIWTEEIARYSFIYMAMLGAAVGVRRAKHFGMTLFTDKLRGPLRRFYLKYVVNGVILGCSVFILVYGWDFAVQYGLTRVSPTFLVPMVWAFLCMPLAAALMIVFAAYNILFEEFAEAPDTDLAE